MPPVTVSPPALAPAPVALLLATAGEPPPVSMVSASAPHTLVPPPRVSKSLPAEEEAPAVALLVAEVAVPPAMASPAPASLPPPTVRSSLPADTAGPEGLSGPDLAAVPAPGASPTPRLAARPAGLQ